VRVLLDESVPRKLARDLVGHDVRTVVELGWAGTQNGELLRRAAAEGFRVLVTTDQNLEYQQNLSRVELAVFVLLAKSNRLAHLRPLISQLLWEIERMRVGSVVRVTAD